MLSQLAIAVIFIFIISAGTIFNNSVTALTDNERYKTGYNWGCSDAKKGGHPYLNSHPTHTAIFMNGYNNGYSACSKSTNTSTATSSENWLGKCKAVEWGLLNSCSTYVSPSGKLTLEGKRAYDCISGGGLLTGAGFLANLPPVVIINTLQPLSKLYNCDGIVDWDELKTASNALSFLKILGIG